MQLKSFSLKTKDGFEHWINRWIPDSDEEIKGIIQLHHGLSEHSLRYDRFGSILADNGYILNAFDMRGHGKTGEIAQQNGTGLMGKIADKNGHDIVVEDLHEITEAVKKDYPGVPVVIMGHSFGSFVTQGFIENYGDTVDACILCGTAGPRRLMIGASKFIVKIIKAFSGNNKYVKLLEKLAFGSYNKGIENGGKNAWLSRDELSVQMYEMDNWCGIPLLASFYYDMTSLLNKIHKSSNIKKINKNLPILFIYGTKDPVGSYGKTIEKLIRIYKKNNIKNISVKKYEGARHEPLNEINKEEVESDIINWISTTLTENKK